VKLLQQLGVTRIAEAADGEQALRAIRAAPIDVIVCDLNMPGMDGVEFIRHVAEEHLAASIVLASGMEVNLIGSVESMAQAHGLTVLGCIEKPLSKQKLANVLRRHRASAGTAASSEAPEFSGSEIRHAIEAGEIVPYYQPEVSFATVKPRAFEVLARWQHGERGLLYPGLFISAVERHGLMEDMTRTLIDRALGQLSDWQKSGLDPQLSFNLSLDYLGEPRVADVLSWIAERRKIDAAHIVLEITETSAGTRLTTVLENLARLRMKGFGISIDDYGTGYSTMQQLSRIPFTQLKIDRMFVSGAASRANMRTILESSIQLANKLGLQSVAEGVEKDEEWSLLKSLGCDLAQGYYIAHPMPAEAVLDWQRGWSASIPANA
jgi:EAL domain-containing protein (putative c-di-GMP-specific phosphodiesterase class I)/CheY-like chemotaxis protein